MNAVVKQQLPAIGTQMEGGFFAGQIQINGIDMGIIVAPKAEGDRDDNEWNGSSSKMVEAALSYDNGVSNTEAMAAAGSELAKWATALRIGGFDDWHVPSQDVLEVCYRNLKPGTEKNACWGRSGINLSTNPSTRPYMPDSPVQTEAEAFKAGGTEAFEEAWYWSSTQCAGSADFAWAQGFNHGHQDWLGKRNVFRARAVRLIKL